MGKYSQNISKSLKNDLNAKDGNGLSATSRVFVLPYPPSVNRIWRRSGRRVYLSKEAINYHNAVVLTLVLNTSPDPRFGDKRLSVSVMLSMPDKRKRDLDNPLKVLLDSLQRAGVFNDDSQIDRLSVWRGPVTKNGSATVKIEVIS